MKVLLAITTGREVFKSTIKMLTDNFSSFGHFERHEIGLLINYDPTFLNLSPRIFSFSDRRYKEIIYIGPDNISEYQEIIKKFGLTEDEISIVSQEHGYGNKKNLVLLRAMLNEYDLVLFWDDDEYPVVCSRESNHIKWIATDIIGTHISSDTNMDVSFGFWSGFVSPILPDISQILSVNTAELLGYALGIGTETLDSSSFIDPEHSFEIVEDIPSLSEIQAIKGGKWVSGGNLGIRTKSVRQGLVPPFYTPPGSRGDDTILSLRLLEARVYRVPSGIFHDCFIDYQCITEGEYPTCFKSTSLKEIKYLRRFAAALLGWLAYAPLFIRLRAGVADAASLTEMYHALVMAEKDLYKEFPELGAVLSFTPLSEIFEHNSQRVENQYCQLQSLTEAWYRLCLKIR